MIKITARLLRMSERQIHNHLTAKRWPHKAIADAMERVRAIKQEARSRTAKQTVAHELWDTVITPAREELGIVRTMRGQARRAGKQPKEDALVAYANLLADLIERLRKLQQAGEYTPLQFVRHLRDELGRNIPNDGAHWTDWVSNRDRVRITEMFNQLPPVNRGKQKEPFLRRISRLEHTRLRRTLIERMETDEANAEQEYDMTTDPDERARLDKLLHDIHHAKFALENLPKTSPLPATWHGLLKQ